MTAPARLRLLGPRLDASALRRAVLTGSAWGLIMAAGMTALDAARCGFVCLDAAAFNAAVAVAAGIVTIGPLAALGRRRRAAAEPVARMPRSR